MLIYLSIILLIFTWLCFYFYRFYYVIVKRYPPGPIPLPVIGNVFSLLGNLNQNPLLRLSDIYGKKYGKVMTFWFGTVPVVIIFDLDIGKEAFSKSEFSGRFHTPMDDVLNGTDYECFACIDYGKICQNMRKVSYEALRNIMSKNKIVGVINEVVEDTIDIIKDREIGRPFNSLGYLTSMFVRIISGVTFSKMYSHSDEELNLILKAYKKFKIQIIKKVLVDLVPITKYFLNISNHTSIETMKEIFRKNFEKCCETHQKDNCNNFCDSVMEAKNLAEYSGSEAAQFLTHKNLIGAINALFIGGSDSTIHTFHWMILIMAYYSEIQTKLREEVKHKIGLRLPEESDKTNCNFILAFICETMRFRNIGPIGFPHKTMSRTKLGEYSVPKDTCVVIHLYSIMNDPKYWSSPELFLPQRFLDSNSGAFIGTRMHSAFIPFSTGKRICVAEKLSLDMSFLVLTRILQLTSGYRFVLPNGPQTDYLKPSNTGFILDAKHCDVILETV